jgi:uncharacterized protein (UPF0303 family)
MDEILKQLLQEEQDLQFTKFNEETAWKIGSQLVEHAMRKKLPVTIDITRGARQIFHASLPGASADNDEWIKRKTHLAYRFEHSSFYMGQLLKSKGKTLQEAYLLAESDYAAHGGCFPIMLKGSGMIGTITISGLPQEEDHQLAVQAIQIFLAQEQ